VVELVAIGVVVGGRAEPVDDHWGAVEAVIRLADRFPEAALTGLDAFSHLEVITLLDRADDTGPLIRRPRGNPAWPEVGIFAQRGKDRPNRLGLSRCRLLGVDGREIAVRGLDAIDGTPVLDVKPWMSAFAPQEAVSEPGWVGELMADYWG
jgi:tRNA (adenine37-N6)-methyltransferase